MCASANTDAINQLYLVISFFAFLCVVFGSLNSFLALRLLLCVFWNTLLNRLLTVMSLAFTPKLFDNWEISRGSRWLFGIYVIAVWNNWMRNSGLVDQQLLKTANRQQQNIDNVILLVENSDIMLGILHKFNLLNES